MNPKEIIDNVMNITQKEVNKYSYPVFISDLKKKPDLIATAVIIENKQKYYLVTASHVLLSVLSCKSNFIIGVNGKYINIEGEFTYSSNVEVDHFDIAYIQLSYKFIESNSICILDESKLLIKSRNLVPNISFVHGFPNSMNKQSKALRKTTSFEVKAYAYGGVIKPDFLHWKECGKTKDVHTSMSYGKKSDHNMPKHPRGISGGGLWIVPDYSDPSNFFLDSIFIEYHEKYGITFSTKISQVVNFIDETSGFQPTVKVV
mgnify:CR=1 FL=1